MSVLVGGLQFLEIAAKCGFRWDRQRRTCPRQAPALGTKNRLSYQIAFVGLARSAAHHAFRMPTSPPVIAIDNGAWASFGYPGIARLEAPVSMVQTLLAGGGLRLDWTKRHILQIAGETSYPEPPAEAEREAWIDAHRRQVEPWLSSIFQGEHLSVLIGSGFTSAVASLAGASATGMSTIKFGCEGEDALNAYAARKAAEMGRGQPNVEDQLSAALILKEGLAVAGKRQAADAWEVAIDRALADFLRSILATERGIKHGLDQGSGSARGGEAEAHRALISFLMSFANRATSRERSHIFTTNYDRLIEIGCDRAGLRLIDRFSGIIAPIFRSSRLQLDMHYNPPGIRGEPRLLEGVVHFTKLHGSIDWRRSDHELTRVPLAFGAEDEHPDVPSNPSRSIMIYPNSAKDIETAAYPYADLFRDFSASVCRPNSVLVTYGYGYGDDHVNRVIGDMLSIPSTHLVMISYGDESEDPHARIRAFYERAGRPQQISLFLGPHFADMGNLTRCYLPRPAIDPHMLRMVKLLEQRGEHLRSDSSRQEPSETGSSSIGLPE